MDMYIKKLITAHLFVTHVQLSGNVDFQYIRILKSISYTGQDRIGPYPHFLRTNRIIANTICEMKSEQKSIIGVNWRNCNYYCFRCIVLCC